MMSDGVVLVCLANSLREKCCSIQNEVNLEDTNDIITTISNNSKEPINIRENEVLCFICYKNYDHNIKMTEMKEKNLYPTLPDIRESPSAPAIDDRGHSHRLKVITDLMNFLEEESSKREAFSKKYFRAAKYVGIVENVLIGATVCTEVAAAVLMSSGVGSPVALGLGIGGIVAGAFSLIGNIVVRKTTIRAEKHLKIKTLASSKLDTIASHVSKALTDDFVSDEEFRLIMEDLNKYKAMKEEIRKNTKKKLKEEEKEILIGRGRQEARNSFRRLVEKNHGGPMPY